MLGDEVTKGKWAKIVEFRPFTTDRYLVYVPTMSLELEPFARTTNPSLVLEAEDIVEDTFTTSARCSKYGAVIAKTFELAKVNRNH